MWKMPEVNDVECKSTEKTANQIKLDKSKGNSRICFRHVLLRSQARHFLETKNVRQMGDALIS
jgi:hypothetical protein